MQKFSKEKLNEVANNSLYTSFTNATTIKYSFQIFERFLKTGNILELGPAEGLMTQNLVKFDENLYVIEGSEIFAKDLKFNFPQINVVNSLFENAEIKLKFDNIVLGHVLEHVENPQIVLEKVKGWLKPDGIVLCAVPNANSIHRQAAVEMQLINSVFDMSEKDIHHGHMRIYTPETFKKEFENAGFQIIDFGGYWLKPISDSQIQETWTQKMLDAFMKLGEKFPETAAEIYIVAKL